MSITVPELVAKLTCSFDAWIVGSAADPENKDPRDYDVLVPFREWQKASQLIPKDAKRNSLGGFKCISDNKEVDVWPGDLDFVLKSSKLKWAYHPFSGIRITKV